MDTILKAHIDLTERAYSIILEENSILKETGKPPEESLLDRKRDLLEQLNHSVYQLRVATENRRTLTLAQKKTIRKAQQLILKTLLLDRENEQLLLKYTRRSAPPPLTATASPHKVNRAYRRPFIRHDQL